MSKQIHFLGWDKPVTDTVARYILNDAPSPLAFARGSPVLLGLRSQSYYGVGGCTGRNGKATLRSYGIEGRRRVRLR